MLDARWKELQREAHPDRFAAHGAAAQRLAMQWSVRINEAYQRLKDPLKRAAYLCELQRRPGQCRKQHGHAASFPDAADGMAGDTWRKRPDWRNSKAWLNRSIKRAVTP